MSLAATKLIKRWGVLPKNILGAAHVPAPTWFSHRPMRGHLPELRSKKAEHMEIIYFCIPPSALKQGLHEF
jgi:hypothetical protein